MIKAEDLRIGNCVQIPFNENYPNEKLTVRVKCIDFDFLLPEYLLVNGYDVAKCDGVPLTPEILEKCGFERRNHDGDDSVTWYALDHAKFDFYTADITKDKGYLIIELEQVEIRRCNYLHEFQNIYYFLTKTELIIN